MRQPQIMPNLHQIVTRPIAPPFPIVAWLERRTTPQRRLGAGLIALVLLAFVIRRVAHMALDMWWFDTVTTASVWSTEVRAQLTMAALALLVAGAILLPTAWSAYRMTPAPDNFPNRLVVRYRQRMGAGHRWLLFGVAMLVILRDSWAAMGQWKPWLLFLHGPNLGQDVSHIGWDLGYHLFRLPFLTVASGWLRQVLLIAGGIALVGYIANGAIKIPRGGKRSSERALRHLGLIAAGYAVTQALTYLFVQWPANGTNQYGAFDGPGFTELKVIVPSLWVMALVAVGVAALMLYGVRRSQWRPALVGLAVWGSLQVALLWVLPALVTWLVVMPAEGERQLPYIADNLEATVAAYGLGSVEHVTESFADGLDGPPGASLESDLKRIPLLNEDQMVAPLQVLMGTTATRIRDVDLDRYEIDGVVRPVLIAARNSSRTDLPEKGWVQFHLVYTHGDGVIAVPADVMAADGRPDLAALAEIVVAERPELYFGEDLAGWYAIVGTNRTEVGGAAFDGGTGIPLTSLWRRLTLGLSVGEIEPVVSSELTDDSQLLYRRDIRERLSALAPFLSFDSNPYPVVADGAVTWIVDGYTSSNTYPHSQFARSVGLPTTSGMSGRAFNYMHASVKATVDAYDGTVHLYRTEVGGADDPILDAWSSIFPGLVEPISNMPGSLRDHLLYPHDLLTVQTSMLGRYHVSDAETLFNGSDSWAVSASAGDGVARASGTAGSTPVVPAPSASLFMPESEPLAGHWVAIRPYGVGSAGNAAAARNELSALAIADHDNPENLRLVRIEVAPGRPVSDPRVAQAAIDTDRDLAALFTLLNANGSAVQFGPMTPIPVEGALVWVRSIVVIGTADATAPRLYGVAAVSSGSVGQADSVSEALKVAVEKLGLN